MAKLVRTAEETMLAEMARGFLDGAAPVGHLRKLRDANETHDPVLWTQMVDMGWAGILIPVDAGGSDMGFSAACVLAQEMGKTLAASPFLSTAVIAATALRQAGATLAMQAIASGQSIYALAIDEHAKFYPENTQLVATADGNGFRLNGQKAFVVDGGLADRVLVLARTDGGLTLFDIAANSAGLTTTQNNMIDSRNAAALSFDNVVATGDDIVGTIDDAMTVLQPALAAGQAALAAETVGLATAAMDMTVSYLKERSQFGVKISSFQALQHRAAHLWCETEVTTSAVLNAGRALDENPDEATLAVSLAKARAIRTAKLAVVEGVQMHGGIGMTDEFDMGFYMKRARVAAEWLGDYGYHAEQIARLRGF
ncbi:acyl-CoA dehydrogenase family protein [Yoonia maritima]|uniref:acyl-CoA dehydrogenase family protein n=1 Tax=Yoonia maritima TaxID=1435347 RepID=UPI0037361315